MVNNVVDDDHDRQEIIDQEVASNTSEREGVYGGSTGGVQMHDDDGNEYLVNNLTVVGMGTGGGSVAVEKSGSDLESSENNTTRLSEDLDDSFDDDAEVEDEDEEGGINDNNSGNDVQARRELDDEGVELGLKKNRLCWATHKSRFRVLDTNRERQALKKERKRRRCILIVAISVALMLLIVIIVGAACGSGHCGDSSDHGTASASSVVEESGGGTGTVERGPVNASQVNASQVSETQDEQMPSDGGYYYDDHINKDGDINGTVTTETSYNVTATTRPTTAPNFTLPPQPSSPYEALGSNVIVLDPTMSVADIQAKCDAIYYQQENNEMGTDRYSIYFLPGTYGSAEQPLMLKLGYYTEMAGLGPSPESVVIYGKIEVYNRCFDATAYVQGEFVPTSADGNCFALNNFWRSLSNLAIQIVSLNQDYCRARAMFWAISQASSMRRVDVRGGDLSLMDYCTQPGYSSGGFIADSRAGTITSHSQQQFFTRSSAISLWEGFVWNQVFMGVSGAPEDYSFPDPPFTTFATVPMKREKPYIYVETDAYGETTFWVRVPSLESETSGVTWSDPDVMTPGRSLAWDNFFVANPSHSAATINSMLAMGKHLILTPGVYSIDESIVVDNANTVILGLGHATLTAMGGVTPLRIFNRPGIILAGVTIDAGTELSDALLVVGAYDEDPTGDITNPITLSDIYFRLGGPHIGKAKVCLRINCNDVLIDHTWVWRADHGVEPFDETQGFLGDNERWSVNVGENGVIVNGDDVVAMGFFVEHFQQYNVIWNGERGRVYFFQNELPYDPPTQQDWMAADGTLGWAAYKVDDSVTDHQLWAGGVYCYNRNNVDIVTANAFEVPQSSGVILKRVFTRNLSGPGTIQAVVNGVGEPVTNTTKGPNYVIAYPS